MFKHSTNLIQFLFSGNFGFLFFPFFIFLSWSSDKTGARLEHSPDNDSNNNRPHFAASDVILASFICNVLGYKTAEPDSSPVPVALDGKCQTTQLDRLIDLQKALR
jgi:hypothetical protein